MPQINLLGQDAQRNPAAFSKGPVYIVRLFSVIFLLILLGWGYLFFKVRADKNELEKTEAQVEAVQKEILAMPTWREVIVRQGQIRAAEDLLAGQEIWSRLLPELARVTLKSASYISFSADANGVARMSVTVPSYKEFDQFLQVFDLPQFSSNFSRITVSSVGKYQQGDTQSVKFDIAAKYNQSFLKATSTKASN